MSKSVLVTGATSGIGQAAASQLAARGYEVFATYRNPSHRAALAELPNVHPIQLDLSDPQQIEPAVQQIEAALADNGLYAVINNAGIGYTAPFEFANVDRVREIIEVNLIAPYLVTQASIPLLRRYNGSNSVKARVINVASWAGMMATPFIGFYNATKAGLVGLSESMYYDLGLLDIHTVLANPGITKTPLHAKTTGAALESLASMPAGDRERYRPYLEHFATMGDRSDGVKMLLSPEQAAAKIAAIVDARKPRYKYNLAVDAKVVDGIVTRFLPFTARARLNIRMYRLDRAMTRPESATAAATKPADEADRPARASRPEQRHPNRDALPFAAPTTRPAPGRTAAVPSLSERAGR
jgi:NAD(P)-dependent dehydrogenase (short-subunit alcohol dehydrogenase family)